MSEQGIEKVSGRMRIAFAFGEVGDNVALNVFNFLLFIFYFAVVGVPVLWISAGFILLGASVDLMYILIKNDNLDPVWLYGLLSYTWTAPITIFGLYVGAELLAPKRKILIVSIYAVLSIVFEIIIFYFWSS